MKYTNINSNKKPIEFTPINEQTLQKINLSNIKFFIVSTSGAIDKPGNVYIFTSDKAFFMDKTQYSKNFLDKILYISDKNHWKFLNLCFCDFLVINPKICDSFTKELYTRSTRESWFQTTTEIFYDWYLK